MILLFSKCTRREKEILFLKICIFLHDFSSTTKNVHYCTIDITNVRVTISDHRPKEDKRISIKKVLITRITNTCISLQVI